MEHLSADELKLRLREMLNSLRSYEAEIFDHSLKMTLGATSSEPYKAEYFFENRPASKNSYGGMHGGMVAAYFDETMGLLATAVSQANVTTADMNISYLKPLFGSRYRIEVLCTNPGRRMVRCEAKCYDIEQQQLCASAMASYIVLDRNHTGGF